jgi:fumarylacetoacetase
VNTISNWLGVTDTHDFSIYNLPFGIFSTDKLTPRAGIAIGDQVVDLSALAEKGLLPNLRLDVETLTQNTLNDFIRSGKPVTNAVREAVQRLCSEEKSPLKDHLDCLLEQKDVNMHLPVRIGDYTDFYSSIEHATNVGKMFRDPENALLPNWKHIPVGYHGRASSVILSGQAIHRPKGQTKPNDGPPIFGPSQRIDFELEMGFIVGSDTELGDSIAIDQAEAHIFGMVLFNDWSARDIQKWEYVPLGPFLAKNFGSSMSPWIVTMEALAPFRVQGPVQEPTVLPYLQSPGQQNYDISLEVGITPDKGEETVISRSNFKYMYWNMAQQLAHHTVNGCDVHVGDLMASGTISGPTEDSYGSMLELAWAGSKPVQLQDGSERKFIQDGDTVTLKGYSEKSGKRVGFGEVTTKILPTK